MSEEQSLTGAASVLRDTSPTEESLPGPSSGAFGATSSNNGINITTSVVCQVGDDETVKSKTTTPSAVLSQDDIRPEGMSKNQWKKMKRLQRREEANRYVSSS